MKKKDNLFVETLSLAFLIHFFLPSPTAKSDIIRSDNIIRWEEFKVMKGFVLSNYLYDHRGCSRIWTKQVVEFQKKNPHIADPDVIGIGEVITMQLCHENALALTPDNEILDPILPVAKDVVEEEIPEVKPEVCTVPEEKPQKKEWALNAPYVHLFLGFIKETGKDVETAYGIGVEGDLMDFVGYNLRGIGSSGAIFLQNEVIFKTKPNKVRGQLLVGLGNRVGLDNKDLDRLNEGADSYIYSGLGLEMQPHDRFRWSMDLTTNLGSFDGVNLGVSAQKKFGADFWLGLYGEMQSTKGIEDKNSTRRFYTSGLKFSF